MFVDDAIDRRYNIISQLVWFPHTHSLGKSIQCHFSSISLKLKSYFSLSWCFILHTVMMLLQFSTQMRCKYSQSLMIYHYRQLGISFPCIESNVFINVGKSISFFVSSTFLHEMVTFCIASSIFDVSHQWQTTHGCFVTFFTKKIRKSKPKQFHLHLFFFLRKQQRAKSTHFTYHLIKIVFKDLFYLLEIHCTPYISPYQRLFIILWNCMLNIDMLYNEWFVRF